MSKRFANENNTPSGITRKELVIPYYQLLSTEKTKKTPLDWETWIQRV